MYFQHKEAESEALQLADIEKSIFASGVGGGDALTYNLIKNGRYCIDIVSGNKVVKNAWIRENGGELEDYNESKVLIERIRSAKPEIVILDGAHKFASVELAAIRAIDGVRWIIGTAGVDISGDPVLSNLDGFITCMKDQAKTFSEQGLPSYFVPHAFDERILEQVGDTGGRKGFVFTGHFVPGNHMHAYRQQLVSELILRTPLKVYGLSGTQNLGQAVFAAARSYAGFTLGKALQLVPKMFGGSTIASKARRAATWGIPPFSWSPRLQSAAAPAVYGLDMYRLMAKSRLALNIHAGVAGPYAANYRMFEATGMGACLLTDWKSDLNEFWEIGSEVLAYRNVKEATAIANEVMASPTLAEEIGRAGHARTLRNHTYAQRVFEFAEAISKITKREYPSL
jgi:spore maturation protein CgeB